MSATIFRTVMYVGRTGKGECDRSFLYLPFPSLPFPSLAFPFTQNCAKNVLLQRREIGRHPKISLQTFAMPPFSVRGFEGTGLIVWPAVPPPQSILSFHSGVRFLSPLGLWLTLVTLVGIKTTGFSSTMYVGGFRWFRVAKLLKQFYKNDGIFFYYVCTGFRGGFV